MNAPVAVGEVLLGKYRVERILGQGGMGIVVAVRHVELGQLSAMKFLLPAAIGREESVERFLREAKAAACLSSEHVAKVQDFGRTEDGALYMLMEYLDGCDLKAYLSRQGPLPVKDAVTYMLQVCEAIGEAHAAGIVHRDLKPANLFLVRRRNGSPCVKVLDFGIAKQMDSTGVDLTNTNAALGTPLYMSPEQMSASRTLDARADIWTLGVILYELLAGVSPFRGSSIMDVALRVSSEEPTPLHELAEDVPPDLEAVIAKCMRKCRDERFQSVDELQTELARFVSTETIARVPDSLVPNEPIVIPDDIKRGETTTTTFKRPGKQVVPKKQRPHFSMTISAGLILAIGGGIVSQCATNKALGSVEPVPYAVPAPSPSMNLPPLPEPVNSTPIVEPDATNNKHVIPIPSSISPKKPSPTKPIDWVKPKPMKNQPDPSLVRG